MSAIMQQPETTPYKILPIKAVMPDPNQPRSIFDDERLQELADSIKANGVIQPIVIRMDGEQAVIVDGERRYRATKLAKVKTIPTIEHVDPEEDPATVLIKQVAANQHEDLKPMEMAAFFDQLVTRHDVKIGKIPELLEQHGIKKIDRAAVSNLRRLVNLPQWAKDMINAGTLSASHGKIILQADDDFRVANDVKELIESEQNNYGLTPSVDELSGAIRHSYARHNRDIYDLGFDRPEFDVETCKGCKTCKAFKYQWQPDKLICLNEECFDKKQTEALAERVEKEAREQQEKAATDSTVDEDSPTYEVTPISDAAKAQQQGRIERTQLYLDQWLREQLATHLSIDNNTLYSILLWCGAGAPGNSAYGYYGHTVQTPDIDHQQSHQHGINLTLKHTLDHADLLLAIVDKALASMDRTNLRRLAHHCNIKLEGNYTVSREYLAIKTKAEMIECAAPVMQDRRDDWAKDGKKPASELLDLIMEYDHVYGVPADLIEFYNEPGNE